MKKKVAPESGTANADTLISKYTAIQKLGHTVTVPFHVWVVFADKAVQDISVLGDSVCLGGDYVSLTEARKATAWYVEQLGGKVVWNE